MDARPETSQALRSQIELHVRGNLSCTNEKYVDAKEHQLWELTKEKYGDAKKNQVSIEEHENKRKTRQRRSANNVHIKSRHQAEKRTKATSIRNP
jgi:hypothetical protein